MPEKGSVSVFILTSLVIPSRNLLGYSSIGSQEPEGLHKVLSTYAKHKAFMVSSNQAPVIRATSGAIPVRAAKSNSKIPTIVPIPGLISDPKLAPKAAQNHCTMQRRAYTMDIEA